MHLHGAGPFTGGPGRFMNLEAAKLYVLLLMLLSMTFLCWRIQKPFRSQVWANVMGWIYLALMGAVCALFIIALFA